MRWSGFGPRRRFKSGGLSQEALSDERSAGA
jgi:hypothetical protein